MKFYSRISTINNLFKYSIAFSVIVISVERFPDLLRACNFQGLYAPAHGTTAQDAENPIFYDGQIL